MRCKSSGFARTIRKRAFQISLRLFVFKRKKPSVFDAEGFLRFNE
jgi:hypothetical protein